MIYVPNDNNYSSCYVVQSEGVIRGYAQTPNYNTTINYRDYYINSSYIYRDGSTTFGTYSTLPTCLNSSVLTNDYYYRLDLDKILICFIIIVVFCFYFPFKMIQKMFGRWFRL